MKHEELKVANQDNLNEAYCPLPLSAIPNQMGINLCSVESVAWAKQDDGQLVSLTINFNPEPKETANDGFGGAMTKKGSRKMKVFMGGTCNESDWRNRIIPMLEVGFFNPVVDDWTPDCMAEELRQREECDVCLYVITPKMTGVYSVAEVIDDSNKRPARTVFVRLRDDGDEKFTDGQWKSLGAVAQMVERNGGTAFDSLKSAALHINAVTPNAEITGRAS